MRFFFLTLAILVTTITALAEPEQPTGTDTSNFNCPSDAPEEVCEAFVIGKCVEGLSVEACQKKLALNGSNGDFFKKLEEFGLEVIEKILAILSRRIGGQTTFK